jgi:RNA polymerase sigma-70 factor (ECF subfamily)
MAQETMIKGFEKIRQLREADQFGRWLIRIARNQSINFVRRSAVSAKAVNGRTHRSIGRDSGNEDLQEAITRLPWDLRLPLVMYYYDGRSVKSVAEALDISTSSVYLKLRTAIRELHETLAATGDRS